MLSHSAFYDINVGKGFSFLVIGKNICRLHCRYHFVLAAIFFIVQRNLICNMISKEKWKCFPKSGQDKRIEKRISCTM
ncbi:hypothetical protein EKA14_08230 [Bacillus mycoides]|nr:hypothetical protein EKA14_08230 [Bacillus mycoides]